MDIDGIEEVEVERETDVSENGAILNSGSILDLLQQDYDELLEAKEVYIRVPGYKRVGLHVLYRAPESGKELDNIATKVYKQIEKSKSYERNLAIAIDTMCTLSKGLYVEHPDLPDEYVMLDPKETGTPVGFDSRLGEILNWDIVSMTTQRQYVRKLFDNNEVAILDHASRLSRWISDAKADVTAEVWQLGEM